MEGIVRNSEFELPPVNMHIVMELMETQGSGPHRELPRNGRARLGEVHYQQPCELLPSFFLFAVLGCNKRLGIALHSWGARPRSKPICHGGHFTALSSMTLLATLSASSPSGMYTALYHCVWRKQKNLPLNFLLLYTWFCFMKVTKF